jgi:hypothetical protein
MRLPTLSVKFEGKTQVSADYFVLASIFVLIGWGVSEYLKACERRRVQTEVTRAMHSLRKKGFEVTFDRLNRFDDETQREMELVRSVGYSVTQAEKTDGDN